MNNKIISLESKKYELKLDNFEGPLDLLCYLIDKNNIHNNSVQVLNQYINNDGNYDIDVFFRSYSGLDKTEMLNKWQLSLDTPVELTPKLFYRNKSFDDAIIESITVEDESILSYENGVLTPLKTGTTKIIIDCSWRGYTYTSWDNGGKREGTGSADLRREVVVTVS